MPEAGNRPVTDGGLNLEVFDSREAASERAAELLAGTLRDALASKPNVTLVVSGGTTPKTCLQRLSCYPLAWHRVMVTLSDERCVPVDHEDSNQRMVIANLQQNEAAGIMFSDLKDADRSEFSAVLLGMGEDGHFALLFPDAADLDTGLDLHGTADWIEVQPLASRHQRISMTLRRLLRTRCLVLLSFGVKKRRVLEAPGDLPVGHLINQSLVPVTALWAA